MFLLANFLDGLADVLNWILWLYMWILIARAVVSWVSPDPRNPIVRFLYEATEPLLFRVRRTVPTVVGRMDLSPLIVIAGIIFLNTFLVQSLRHLAFQLQF